MIDNHVYKNYKTFIKMADQLKVIQGQVGDIKSNFLAYEDVLAELKETLYDEKMEKKSKKQKEQFKKMFL